MKKLVLVWLAMVMGLVLTASQRAGTLYPSWGPQSGSGMYTLSEVYYYLTEGREGSIAGSFQDPAAGPGSTMMNTKVIYDGIKAEFDGCDAGPGDVLSGTTFFNIDTSAWGAQAGTMPNESGQVITPTTTNQPINAGYHDGSGYTEGDTDLATGNIRQGVHIFGIPGDPCVADTESGTAGDSDILSGQVAWVDGSEVTGTIETRSWTSSTTEYASGFYPQTDLARVDDDLAAGNIKQGITVFGIEGNPNVADTSTGNAGAGDILSGQVAWVHGSEVTGTIETRSWTSSTTAYNAGFYDQTDLAIADPDLAEGNIRAGKVIFGVDGAVYGGPNYITSPLLESGQIISYRDGDDGYCKTGVSFNYQTEDIGGDLVTVDLRTGLMWAADGSAKGCNFGAMTGWGSAILWAHNLSFAGYSDWRLPNIRELSSLLVYDAGIGAHYINHTFFPGTQVARYWSSTSCREITGCALYVDFSFGSIYRIDKEFHDFLPPVYLRVVRGANR